MDSDQQRHLSPGAGSRGAVSQTSSTGSFILESADHSTEVIQIHHSPPAGSGVKVCRQLGAQREHVPFSPYSLSRNSSARNGKVDATQQQSSQRPSRNSSHKSLLQANRSPNRQLSTDFSSSPYVLLGRKSPSPLHYNRTTSSNNNNNEHPPQLHQQDELTGSNETHALTTSSNVASPTTPHPPAVPKNAALSSFGPHHLHNGPPVLTHSDTTTAVGCNSRSASPRPLNETELEHYLDTTVTPSSTATPTGDTTVPPSPAKWNLVESPQDVTLLQAKPNSNNNTNGAADRSSSLLADPRDVSPFIFSGATSASDIPDQDDGVSRGVPTPPSSNIDTRSRGPSMLQVDSSQVSPANSRKGTASINNTTTRSKLGLGGHLGSYAEFDDMGWAVSRQVSYAYRTMSTVEDRRVCTLLAGAEIEDDGVGNCMIDDYLMNEEPFQKTQHSKVYLAYDTKKVMDTPSSNMRAIKKIRLPLVEESGSNSVSRTNSQQSASGGVGAKEISDKDLQRLGREISIWKSLSNRYIVPLYKVLVSSDKRDAYLVMEYMEGGTLLSPATCAPGDDDNSSDDDVGGGRGAARHSIPHSSEHLSQLPPTFTFSEKRELNKCGPKQYEPLPLTEIKRYIEQLSGALTYLHGKGITHYDVKPENVLLTKKSGPTGRTEVRLTDFGTSELQSDKPTIEESIIDPFFGSLEDPYNQGGFAGDAGAASRMASMGFRKNFIKGTHKYLAPEAFKPIHESSPQADTRPLDMWALGVTLYAMATGHFPFKGTNVNAIRDSATNDTPYYPPSMEKAIKYLCERLLRKDPSTRWTAEKLYATLHKRRMDGALSTKPARHNRRTSVSIPSVKASSTTTASTPSNTNTPTHIQVGNEVPAHEAIATWRSRPESVATVLTTGVVSSTSSSEVPLLSLGSPEGRKHHQLHAARAAAAADPHNLSSAPVSRQPSEGGLLKLIRTQSNATDHTNLDAREVDSMSSLPCTTHRSHHLGDHATILPGFSQERQPSSVHTTDRDEDLITSGIPSRNRSPLDSISNPPNHSHGGPLEDGVDENEEEDVEIEGVGGAVDSDEAAAMQNSSNSGHSSDNYLNGDMFDGGTSFALSKEQQAWVMEQVLKEARQGNNDGDMENVAVE